MTACETSADRQVALQHLSSDVFANLVTLKMLTLYPDSCTTTTIRRGNDWSCMTELDVSASHWDRRAYPGLKSVVLLDGSSDDLLELALERSPKRNIIYKIHHAYLRSRLAELPGARLRQSFHSYSTPPAACLPLAPSPLVHEYFQLTPEAYDGLAQNGYSPEELQAHFRRGASWLGLTIGGRCVSLCLVLQNFGDVWEIGGVHTHPDERRKGYAKLVVRQALYSLRTRELIPRYQFRSDNTPSRALAEAVGLQHILTVDHYSV